MLIGKDSHREGTITSSSYWLPLLSYHQKIFRGHRKPKFRLHRTLKIRKNSCFTERYVQLSVSSQGTGDFGDILQRRHFAFSLFWAFFARHIFSSTMTW
jgi:hypothetical protein